MRHAEVVFIKEKALRKNYAPYFFLVRILIEKSWVRKTQEIWVYYWQEIYGSFILISV